MHRIHTLSRLSIVLIAAHILSACGGGAALPGASEGGTQRQAGIVAFTGTVEAVNGDQWVISGQPVTVAAQAILDPNITLGKKVKVEASISPDGEVVALKVESSGADDVPAAPSTSASNTPVPSGPLTAADGNEVFGVVEAMTTDSITVGGVTYTIADYTEFKDAIFVGDPVKLHVIVNADGTLTIREIEIFAGTGVGNDNSANSNDDNGNAANSNDHNGNDDNGNASNSNDDDRNENNGGNGNDDHGGNGNGGGGGNGNGNGDDD